MGAIHITHHTPQVDVFFLFDHMPKETLLAKLRRQGHDSFLSKQADDVGRRMEASRPPKASTEELKKEAAARRAAVSAAREARKSSGGEAAGSLSPSLPASPEQPQSTAKSTPQSTAKSTVDDQIHSFAIKCDTVERLRHLQHVGPKGIKDVFGEVARLGSTPGSPARRLANRFRFAHTQKGVFRNNARRVSTPGGTPPSNSSPLIVLFDAAADSPPPGEA